MKTKLFLIIILILGFSNLSIAESYKFDVNKIDVTNNGNIIVGYNGNVISKKKDLNIVGKKFKYFKEKDILEASSGTILIGTKNLEIKFQKLKIDNKNLTLIASDGIKINDIKNSLKIESETVVLDREKNILTASDGIKINDIKNSLKIESETVVLDKKNQLLYSKSKTKLIDKYQNTIKSKSFEYNLQDKLIKISSAKIKDIDNNNFKIETGKIDILSNTLVGKDIKINLNNKSFNKDNEPRLVGKSITYQDDVTEIYEGLFTTCKETESCPPWELSAKKITHNRKKKSISYQNVWLKLYDLPVLYFPKFFHPDPSVDRQSGFLMPSFKSSTNNNTYFSVPYFKALDQNKDFTITPRLYNKDQLLVQNEYREINKNSNIINDVSIFADKDNNFEGHLFYNLTHKINLKNFNNSNIDLKIEQVSKDSYLKKNRLLSPIINNYDLLENSLKLGMSGENLDINADFLVYEKLNIKKSSDKYEYVFPKIELIKNLENKTNLNGNFSFKSKNYIHNYNTNIFERVNTNDLIFNSEPRISKKGFYNNYEFIVKNSNSKSEKSQSFKEGSNFNLSSLVQLNSSYPLIKKNNKFRKILKPKVSIKFNPSKNKDLSKNENILDVNNIFNLDRISSENTLESGLSMTYGLDYILADENGDDEIFSIKLANNLRLKENNDLEKNHQLGDRTSNFFGELSFSPLNFINSKYKISTLNNLSDINYQNLITEIKYNNFVTTLDYLRQDGDKNSYILNKTTYNFNESNGITFSTRENLKSDLTEYYNLIYQYKNDCLVAGLEYQKEYYKDSEIDPTENIFLSLTIIPFGETRSPNLKE